ncbi:MAG: hypothetical protein J7L66_01755 [Anaerolineaceae bacterium]|nr:hypothetical protein [Anaerolineaceae bacterium]
MLLLSVIQSAAISRISILGGTADIVLLAIISRAVSDDEGNLVIWALTGGFFISLMTKMPAIIVLITYIVSAGITRVIQKQFWQSPILTIILSSTVTTIIKFIIDAVTLQFINIQFPIIESLAKILFPSIVLNLFFLFPTYLIMNDLSKWLAHKKEISA